MTANLTPGDIKQMVVEYLDRRGYAVDPESFRLNAEMRSPAHMAPDQPTATGATITVKSPDQVGPHDFVTAAENAGGWGQ